MFLFDTVRKYIKLLQGARFGDNPTYKDDLNTFFRFYNFIDSCRAHFTTFLGRFDFGFNSKFLYIYLVYYLLKKYRRVVPGDLAMLIMTLLILNKSFLVKVFKPYH
jgi:hypothetical protein